MDISENVYEKTAFKDQSKWAVCDKFSFSSNSYTLHSNTLMDIE